MIAIDLASRRLASEVSVLADVEGQPYDLDNAMEQALAEWSKPESGLTTENHYLLWEAGQRGPSESGATGRSKNAKPNAPSDEESRRATKEESNASGPHVELSSQENQFKEFDGLVGLFRTDPRGEHKWVWDKNENSQHPATLVRKMRRCETFNDFGIVLHFMVWPGIADRLASERSRFDAADGTMDQIERDLLSNNIRDLVNRPFQSKLYHDQADLRIDGAARSRTPDLSVTVTLPQLIAYKGEGANYALLQRLREKTGGGTLQQGSQAESPGPSTAGGDDTGESVQWSKASTRNIKLNVTPFITHFRNGSYIFHLGLTNAGIKRNVANFLTDLELISLVKLWEEGEQYQVDRIRFAGKDVAQYALEVMEATFGAMIPRSAAGEDASSVEEERGPRMYLAGGTIQLVSRRNYEWLKSELSKQEDERINDATPSDSVRYLVKWLKQKEDDKGKRKLENADKSANAERNSDETQSDAGVIARPLNDRENQVGLGLKGMETGLLDILNVDKDELWDSLGRFESGPNARDRLAVANKGTLIALCAQDRVYEDHRKKMSVSSYLWLPHAISLYNSIVLRTAGQKFRQSQEDQREATYQAAEWRMRQLLQEQYLQNIFHYPLERHLFDKCNETRGNQGQYGTLHERLRAIDGILQEMRENRERVLGWVLEFLVGVLAVFQVVSGYEQLNKIMHDDGDAYWSLAAGVSGVIILIALGYWKYANREHTRTKISIKPVLAFTAIALAALASMFALLSCWQPMTTKMADVEDKMLKELKSMDKSLDKLEDLAEDDDRDDQIDRNAVARDAELRQSIDGLTKALEKYMNQQQVLPVEKPVDAAGGS